MVARANQVFIAWGSQVLQLTKTGTVAGRPLPADVRRLAASPQHTRVRVAAAFDEGGVVLWEDGASQPFGQGLTDPRIAFTRSGFLVAAAAEGGRVYRTVDQKVVAIGSFEHGRAKPLAVLPTNVLNEFALLSEDGWVSVFQIPG